MSRILIVEDEVSFSDPLSYLLKKEGYDVAVAETGPDGLAEFDKNGADLVLLDLMLPGLSGVDVCRALRQRSSVPVIMLTAKDSEIDKVVGLEIGADDYVTKPYSSREPARARQGRAPAPRRAGGPAALDPRVGTGPDGRRAPHGQRPGAVGVPAAQGVRACSRCCCATRAAC